MPEATSTLTQSLVDDVYARMFGDQSQLFDLYEGTANSPGGAKIIYLSTDILVGMYRAIEYEAGEAWKVIFGACGQRWGRRVVGSFERELRVATSRRADSLTVDEFKQMVEAYFVYHGWGRLHLLLDGIEEHGVLEAELRDSLFRYALPQVEGVVDHMIGGMLCGMFESLGQASLDFLVHDVGVQDGVPVTRFVVSGPDRVRSGQALLDSGRDFAAVVEQVKAA